jgi:hypothetical protein
MRLTFVVAVGILLAAAGFAQAQFPPTAFPMSGDQEVPPVTTDGSGTAIVSLEDWTDIYGPDYWYLSWNITYQDLTGPASGAHFHAPAPVGENAGVVINFANFGPITSPIVGSTIITDLQAQQIMDGLWYANIHTQQFPGGEIRGQIPEPATALLATLSGLALMRRRHWPATR